MKMFEFLFSKKTAKPYLDIEEIKVSIESTRERVLREQEEIKESVRKADEEINRGIGPQGKKFRL